MRLAAVPMFFYPDRESAIRMSGESWRTTHGAAECVQASRLFGAILFDALAGRAKEDILLDHHVTGLTSESVQAIAAGRYRSKSENEIRGSGYVVDSLEAALWTFWQTSSFEDAVLSAVNLGDDADTTAAICGQLAGAFYGEAGIPRTWLQKLVKCDDIRHLADRLYEHQPER